MHNQKYIPDGSLYYGYQPFSITFSVTIATKCDYGQISCQFVRMSIYLKTIHIISVLQGIKGGAIVQSIGKQNWVKLMILSPGGLFSVLSDKNQVGTFLPN